VGHQIFIETVVLSNGDDHCLVPVLFCSLAVLDPRVGHTMDVLFYLSLSSVILTDSSTESPVHVLVLSIQAMCGFPHLRAPDIVPGFLMV